MSMDLYYTHMAKARELTTELETVVLSKAYSAESQNLKAKTLRLAIETRLELARMELAEEQFDQMRQLRPPTRPSYPFQTPQDRIPD